MKSTFCQSLMNVNEFHLCQLPIYQEILSVDQYLYSNIKKKESHLVCFRVCDDVTLINCRHPVEWCSVFIDRKDVCHLNLDK